MKAKTFWWVALTTMTMAFGALCFNAVKDQPVLLRANEVAVTSCAGSVKFGDIGYTADHYSSSAASSGSTITAVETHKFNPTITAGSNVFKSANGYSVGIKLGGKSTTGSITLSFDNNISISSIVLYTNKGCTQSSTVFSINDTNYTCATKNYNFDDISGSNARGFCTYSFDVPLMTSVITITGKKLCIGYISIY